MKNNSIFYLYMPEYLLNDLKLYVNQCPKEIGGPGLVKRISSHEFYLLDLVLLERKTGPASVEPTPDAFATYLNKLTDEQHAQVRFYWHSHPGMSTHPSSIDEGSIRNLARGHGWIIWLIANQKNEMNAALEITTAGNDQFRFPLEIKEKSRKDEIKEEIKKKIRDQIGEERLTLKLFDKFINHQI